jgi:Ca-activated chloride channel family protein
MSDLSFLAPTRLWLLVLPLLFAVGYVLVQRRRRTYTVRFTNLDLLDTVAPNRPGWRRHLPAAVLLLGIVAATLGFAKPALAVEKTSDDGIVMLALDTSLSMEATDVQPSRIDAAKEAAKHFLDLVPKNVKVGVIGFDGNARTVLAPVADIAAAKQAVDSLQLGEGTAIGEAVFTALADIDQARANNGITTSTTAPPANGKPAATIVLLSDGETTVGRPNNQAGDEAAKQGVPVNTIAFGTDQGQVRTPDGQMVAVPVNATALKDLADQTHGSAYDAQSASQLHQVFENLGKTVTREPGQREVADWFSGMALVFVALAASGSLLWFSRLP